MDIIAMIIDFHAHVGKEPPFLGSIEGSPEKLVKIMDSNGIDKAVIFPMPSPKISYLPIAKKANDYIHESVLKFRNRLIGFCMVTPYTDEDGGAKEIARCVRELGMKGLKLHPDHCGFPLSPRLMEKIFDESAKLRIPITIHCGGLRSTAAAIGHLASEYPEVPVIIAHMGGGIELAGEAISMLQKIENVYADTAEGPAPFAIRTAVKSNPSKVLFGSDFFTDWDPYPFELSRIKSMKLNSDEEKGVLGANAAKLLQLL